jgi:uncharacterized phage protein (TIGR02220 family)
MARSRNVKPGFFKNEYLAELEPLTRLLFEGLWCLADREGRLEDRPKKIKIEVLPYDNCDIDKMLDALMFSKERFIARYEVNGEKYIQISNFRKHQTPHATEIDSVIPEISQDFQSTLKVLQKDFESTTEIDRKSSIEVLSNKESVISKEGGMGEGIPELPKEETPYKEIIDYLNEKAKTKYRHTSTATQTLIRARLSEKYTVKDFKSVIDNKVAEWLDTEQEPYLRPETLFCAKHFESYLNQKNKPPGKAQSPINMLQKMYQEAEDE